MAWSAEQIGNAKIIINVGRQLGASDRDIVIALMAGWQESGLRNLNYGDRDSIGMFQQRNAWGSRADRLDPVKSTRMFFLGGSQGQRGLLDFKNRDQFDLGQMAQKVQVSAFPNAYAKWQDESEQLMKELGGGGGKPTDVGMPPPEGYDETERTIVPSYAQEEASGALSALGVGSPTSAGVQAAGAGSAASPGAESADKQPSLGLDAGLDPEYAKLLGLMPEDQGGGQGMPDDSGFDLPDPTDGGSYKRGNYDLPGVKSYVQNAANELGGRFGIKTIGGVGDRPNKSDHPGGKALDFMTRDGNALAAFAEKNWKRLNIKYIIWNQHIWSPSRAGEGWRLMEDRGGDTANHRDHVHISFS